MEERSVTCFTVTVHKGNRSGKPRRAGEARFFRIENFVFYEVEDCPPPKPFKDYNQWLQTAKRCISAPVPEKR